MPYIPTTEQVADILSKGHPTRQDRLIVKLTMRTSSNQFEGECLKGKELVVKVGDLLVK